MKSRRRVNSNVVRLLLSSMARLDVKFPDRSHLLQEPRGEDPLVYYLPDGDWSRSMAVEILPLYEEWKTTVASTRFRGRPRRATSIAAGR